MKHCRFLVLLLTVLAVLSGCSKKITRDTMDDRTLYDTVSGNAVQLGMDKTQVDNMFDGIRQGEFYIYDNALVVWYSDGKAETLMLSGDNNPFIANNGITIGSPSKDVREIFGEPSWFSEADTEDALFLDYYREGKESYVLRFIVNKDGVVAGVTIRYYTLVPED